MRQEDTSNSNTNANQGTPNTNQESTPDSTPSQDTTKKKKTGPKRRKVTHGTFINKYRPSYTHIGDHGSLCLLSSFAHDL